MVSVSGYLAIKVMCPRCSHSMEWAATTTQNPHIVDYYCENCAWKGDYNHREGSFAEYSAEDYVISENWDVAALLVNAKNRGCEVKNA